MRDVPGLNSGSRHNDVRDRYGVAPCILTSMVRFMLWSIYHSERARVSAEKLTSWAIPHSGRFGEEKQFFTC